MEEKLAGMLLIDMKGAFDYVSLGCLLYTMVGINAYGDLLHWTESFMSDRKVGLVIDGHQYAGT